jgi:uncharacterized membrane protein YesL
MKKARTQMGACLLLFLLFAAAGGVRTGGAASVAAFFSVAERVTHRKEKQNQRSSNQYIIKRFHKSASFSETTGR